MSIETELYCWPPEGVPSFVSETGEDGDWHPVCDVVDRDGKPIHDPEDQVRLWYRFTPWGSWHCPPCGTTHLIWAEDWPDAEQEEE